MLQKTLAFISIPISFSNLIGSSAIHWREKNCFNIMLKVFVGVLMIVSGVTSTELCNEPAHRVCRDENPTERFPETAEELQDFCNSVIGFSRCGVKYSEKCDPGNDLHGPRSYLTALEDVCNEDTLLYAAIVDNLQCFNELRMKGPVEECRILSLSPSVERLHKYAEALVEEGHSVFTDDESEVNNTLGCIRMLQEIACYATKLEDKCGTIAMDTYVEIIQKFSASGYCGETYHYLPTVIRVYKLEEEEANEIAAIFKKRK